MRPSRGFGRVSSADRLAADRFFEDLVAPARTLRLPSADAAEHDPANDPVLQPGIVGPPVDIRIPGARIAVLTPSAAFPGSGVRQAPSIDPTRAAFAEAFRPPAPGPRARRPPSNVTLDYAPGEPSDRHVDHADFAFAGTDAQRWASLRWGLFDNATVAAIASAGGYGAMRILPDLESHVRFTRLAHRRRAPAPLMDLLPPKRIAGFSDFTAVLLATYSLLGWAGIHGPMLCCAANLDRLVRAMTVAPVLLDPGGVLADNLTLVGALPAGGVAGVLLGGNLTLVDALYGSPSFPSLQGAILFVEETNEPGRKIDRMIEGLKLRGAASQVRAVVVGHVTGADTIAARSVATLFNRSWNVPVAFGLEAGHVAPNRAFWVGLNYALEARPGGRAALLLPP